MKTIRSWRRALVRRAARHGESGQALAEIAIALPLLLMMLIGIWEFARAYQIQQVVVNAAREGARIVVLPNSSGGTVDSATNAINAYLAAGSISGASINITGVEITGEPMTVQVSVPYSFNLIGPVIRLATGSGGGGPGDITLASQATMRHE